MKFDPDLIDAVAVAAPNGIEFEETEIVEALATVADLTDFWATAGSLVQRAAARELRRRNPLPPKPPQNWFQRHFRF